LVMSLFINNLLAAVRKLRKKSGTLILRDERGVLEPHSDVIATALAIIGFVVFAALLSRAYMGYEDRSFALENYESASFLAGTLAEAPALRDENPGTLSASALDKLSGPGGHDERMKFFAAFSGNYPFLVEIRTGDGKWQWLIEPEIIEPGYLIGKQEKVAASVPVVIKLNPAESVPGTLTVVLYKTPWM
jgi:hypothetical protein